MVQATRDAREDMGRVFTGKSPTHSDLRDRVLAIVTLTVIFDLIASLLIWMFERHQPGTDIRTFGDALFWVTSQLLTVSSSLRNPVGTGARILDVLLEIWAISVVAALAGSFAAFFHRRSRERHGPAQKQADG